MHVAFAWLSPLARRGAVRAAAWLRLEPDALARLVPACLFQFAFVGGVAMLKASSNALVHDVRTLPLLYALGALTTGAVAALAAWLSAPRRWPPTMTLAGWAAAFLIGAFAAHAGWPLASEAVYLAAEVYATTLSVRFWARMGELFDVRASRRVLGIVGGVGMAGSMAGGLATHQFVLRLGAVGMIPVAVLSLAACGAAARWLSAPLGDARPVPAVSTRKGAGLAVLGDGLPRTMALLVALLSVLSAVVDLLFRMRAKALFDSAAQAALFGDLSVVVGAAAMSMQLVLTGPMLRRVGLFGFLAVTPALVMLTALLGLFVDGMWAVYALKAVEQMGALSLVQTGMQLLYGPMPDELRASARNAIDGFFKKSGLAMAGVVLFLLASHLTERMLAGTALALGGLALVLLWQLRGHYVRAVSRRLKTSGGDGEGLRLADGTALGVLEAAVADPDEGKVLTALALLSRHRRFNIDGVLVRALGHGSARVRREAARLSGERGVQACAVRLSAMAVDDVAEVREAAIEAVAHLRPFTAARLLGPLVQHPDLGTRLAALAALVPLDASGTALVEVERLVAARASSPDGERAQVARLLGRLGGRHVEALHAYLHDGSPRVRRAACEAAGDACPSSLVEDLLALLVVRDTRREARRALVRYGDAVVDRLEQLLNDKEAPADLRYRLPRILRGIGTARALEVILFSNPKDDPFLHYRLSAAAARIREAHPDVVFDRTRALEATLRRLEAYDKLLGAYRDLAPLLGPSELLVRALGDRLDQHLESAVRLAGLVAPQRPVQNAWNRFRHGDERTRPYAVELLEHLVDDRTLARRLSGALERWHRLPTPLDGAGEDVATRLLELLSTRDVVLRAIAIATVHRLAALRGGGGVRDAAEGLAALASSARGPVWEMLLEKPPVIPEEGPVSEQIVEKVLFLEGCDIFGESDVDDLTAVAQQLKERPFRAGEVLFQEDDPGDALFVIVEGRVKLEKGTRHLFDLGPRDSFGETSLLDNKPRPASATALTDGVLFVLERADFLDLVSDRVELLRGIFGVVTRDLRSVLDAAAAGRLTAPGSGHTAPGRPRSQTG